MLQPKQIYLKPPMKRIRDYRKPLSYVTKLSQLETIGTVHNLAIIAMRVPRCASIHPDLQQIPLQALQIGPEANEITVLWKAAKSAAENS